MNLFHLGIYGIILKQGSLILVHKSRGPYTDLLDLPGGSPKHGESITQTLEREVHEETGIFAEASSLFDTIRFLTQYTEFDTQIGLHHTCLLYLIDSYKDSDIAVKDKTEDVSSAGWYPIHTIELEKTTPAAAHVLKILRNNPILW